jgi:hypothetical protein
MSCCFNVRSEIAPVDRRANMPRLPTAVTSQEALRPRSANNSRQFQSPADHGHGPHLEYDGRSSGTGSEGAADTRLLRSIHNNVDDPILRRREALLRLRQERELSLTTA